MCLEKGIPSEIFLTIDIHEFKKASVSFAGKYWVERFDKLMKGLPVRILSDSRGLEISDNMWSRANLWLLDRALKNGGAHMTLIALWDREGGDGDGTGHMVSKARVANAKVEIININEL